MPLGEKVKKDTVDMWKWKFYGKEPDYISPEGDYGTVPYSELAMFAGYAGKKIKRYGFFKENGRIIYGVVETERGILHGLPGEVFSDEIMRKHNLFGR
jgi:hypothetical protein